MRACKGMHRQHMHPAQNIGMEEEVDMEVGRG